MRRWIGVWVLVLAIVVGTLIGITSYNAGVNEGISRAANSSQVIQVVRGPGYGFFPFGLFLFPLLFFGTFALIGGVFRRRAWGRHDGSWGEPGAFGPKQDRVREWHRKLHEEGVDVPNAPPPPA